MPLARCTCGQVFDIPGVERSYRQPDGRCADCNHKEPPMHVPAEITHIFAPPSSALRPEIKVETHVPLPVKATRQALNAKYPFDALQAPKGGTYASFYVEASSAGFGSDIERLYKTLQGSANSANRKRPTKHRYAYQRDESGVRVWRIK